MEVAAVLMVGLGALGLMWQNIRLRSEVAALRNRRHSVALSSIREYVGDTHAAEVLRAAAHAYDTIEAKGRMEVLGRQRRDGTVSLPAAWMLDRAHMLDPATSDIRIQDRAHPWKRTP